MTCAADDGGCSPSPRIRRGLCDKHYSRWQRHGDTSTVLRGLATRHTVEDLEWILGTDHPERIARRLGRTPATLTRMLERAGRHDLAAPFRNAEDVA